jgi:E3 ubiquitin-protein ligase TRIP12
MKLLGIFLARALLAEAYVDLRFNETFFTLMRGEFDPDSTLELLAEIDPQLYLALTSGAAFGSDFLYPGSIFPMKEGGEHCVVDSRESEFEFIELVASWTCGTEFRNHFREFFIGGFDSVFPFDELAKLFSDRELCSVFHGESPVFTAAELSAALVPTQGYTRESREIVMLKRLLHEMTNALREKFLSFVTALKYLPIGGLRALSPPLTVIPREVDCDPDVMYPMSMTCVHLLKLPQYSSMEVMRKQLLAAIRHTSFFGHP